MPKQKTLADLIHKVLKEDRGLLVTEIVPLVQAEIQIHEELDPDVPITSVNEKGIADLLKGDARFEVTEGSRWRLKGD